MKINIGSTPGLETDQTFRSPDHNYKSLLEALPVPIYTCDRNGAITFYNSHAAELWGREPELGKDMWCGSFKIFRPDGKPLPLDECPMATVLKTGEAVKGQEIIIERPDGSRLSVVPHPSPLFDENGKMYGAINMLMDISTTKADGEKAARLTAVVESSVAAIVSKTLEGIVTSWNPAAERIFGFTPQEMIGQPITKLIPHDRLDEEASILSSIGRGEKIDHYETKRLTKDLKLIDVSLTISPIRNEKGVVIGASKIARDITKSKEIQRLMRESQERFRMAVEAIKLGTWQYEPVKQEFELSRECKNIFGVPEDMPVDFYLFLKLIHDEDRDHMRQELEKSMMPSGNGNLDIEFRIVRYQDTVKRWVRTQGKVYFDHLGVPQRLIGTVLDITDDKNAKEELEQLVSQRTEALEKINKQLQRSNAELAQFASVASHDLQEPLRKVQMYSDRILQNPADPEAFQKYFPKIINASARMSQLIKDILHYAQIGEGNEKFTDVDLNETMEQVYTDFELKIRELNAKVNMEKLPVLKGNRTQLFQLFSNLMSNSLKFSKRTPVITINSRKVASIKKTDENKQLKRSRHYHEITFSDNGIGFNQEFSTLVFDIFQRLEDRENYTGTGIGLAVCKKIVENHRGLITVNSKENEGTVFTILLPAD